MKDDFILYGEWEEHFKRLPPSEQGELIMALFAYNNRKELPGGSVHSGVGMAFSFIRIAMDENAKRYELRCLANQENGKLGGRPKNPNKPSGFCANPAKTKKPDTGSDSVSDTGSVPPMEGGKKRASKPRFTPPTLEEVAAYVVERKSVVDPQGFIDFYAAKGWLVGKTPMKDWKAACRNAEKWERWTRTTATERPQAKAESFAERAARMRGAET